MPINKNALIRYQALDRCFSNPGRSYFIEDLLEEVNNALSEYNSATGGIRRRQLFDDIKFMESENGWNIELDKIADGKKKYYRYSDTKFSINNKPINEMEAEQIKSALLVLSRFKGTAQFGWVEELIPKIEQAFGFKGSQKEIISFDSNQYLKGIEHLGTLFNAILYRKVLKIAYQSFKTDKPETFIFHPYYLKQYNNRWFLLGRTEGFSNLSVRSFDRIESINEVRGNYIENTEYDFSEYFDDIIGITKPKDFVSVLILLHFLPTQSPYILTKPIHGSQKKKNIDERGLTISIDVIPNYELKSLLLSFGNEVKVLSPQWLHEELQTMSYGTPQKGNPR